MNLIVIFSLLTITWACSHTDLPEEESQTEATNFSFRLEQESTSLNGLELVKHAAIAEQLKTRHTISKLKEAIRAGKRYLLPQLEAAQQKEADIEAYKESLTMIVRPRAPYPPRPPRGCFDDPQANCGVPKINLKEYPSIELARGLEHIQVEIYNAKNQLVGRGSSLTKSKDGSILMNIKSELNGEGTLKIRPQSKVVDEGLFLDIPVYAK